MGEILTRWFAGNMVAPQVQSPESFWLHLASDAVTGLACFSIAVAMLYIVRRRPGIQLKAMFLLYAAFIFSDGAVRLLAILLPGSWAATLARALTAAITLIIAVMLWRLVPRIVRLPSRGQMAATIEQLEHEIADHRHIEEALRQSQATLRDLAAYQEKIKEDERKRIAREIHDELGQNLLALRIDISMLHARTLNHPRLNQRVGAALEQVDTTMKSIRAIMNNLRPAVLDLGLYAAIEWQVKEFRRLTGIECELVMTEDHELTELDDAQATAIFRVLQESLTNIRRHARATRVRIDLSLGDGRLAMAVDDNGVGMYPKDRRKAHRFGLVGMQERIAMLGGELRIDSVPGQGTVLRLDIPVNLAARSLPAADTGT